MIPTTMPATLPEEIREFDAQVKTLTINTPAAHQLAAELMVKIRKARKHAEDALKAACLPFKAQIKALQDEANVGITLLQNNEATLQRGIQEYQRKAREEAAKKQAQELAKYEKRVERLEAKAEAAGAPLPVIPPPPVIAPPPRQVQTEAGTLGTQKVKRWRIPGLTEDELRDVRRDDPRLQAIPDSFFVLNASEIAKLVRSVGRAGVPLPGCPGVEVYEEESLRVR